MKQFIVSHGQKEYHVFARDSIEAVKKIKDMAILDMPMAFKSNVRMESFVSNIKLVKSKPDATNVNSIGANIHGIMADIQEWQKMSNDYIFDDAENIRVQCRRLCDKYLDLLQDKELIKNAESVDKSIGNSIYKAISSLKSCENYFKNYKRRKQDSLPIELSTEDEECVKLGKLARSNNFDNAAFKSRVYKSFKVNDPFDLVKKLLEPKYNNVDGSLYNIASAQAKKEDYERWYNEIYNRKR